PAYRVPEAVVRRRLNADALRSEVELQTPGVQVRTVAFASEERITDDRVSDPREMDTDLVAPAGPGVDHQYRLAVVAPFLRESRGRRIGPYVLENRPRRYRPAAVFFFDVGSFRGDPHAVLPAGAERQVDGAAVGKAARTGDREVALA